MLSVIASALIAVPALSVQPLPESESYAGRGFFIENVGQFAGAGRFVLQGDQGYTWAVPDGIWITRFATEQVPTVRGKLAGRNQYTGGNHVHIRFANANLDAALVPFGRLDTHVSYLKGADSTNWHTDVPAWSGVRYVEIYPGIDLLLKTDASGLFRWEYEARSGAQLEKVQMVIEGASDVVSSDGILKISTNVGDYGVVLPEVSTPDGVGIHNSQSHQTVTELTDDVFQIDAPFADPQAPLLMVSSLLAAEDLIFSTYVGGAATDAVNGVDVNSLQEVFVAGNTISTDFPTTPGAFDPNANNADGFVIRFNKYGTGINYATYIGGSNTDEVNGIALDGNTAFIVGSTYSDDFPLAGPRYSDSFDAFVAALNATGTDLIYAKLHGGEADDNGFGIDVESNLAYITGTTWSKYIPGASAPAKMRGFAAKFDSSGNRLYGEVFGGRSEDAAYAIKVSGGSAYITGESDSFDLGPGGSFIIGFDDTYVIKFSPTGEKIFVLMLGGDSYDRGNWITVDSSGRAIIAGTTDPLDFPASEGMSQGGYDGFLAVLNNTGTAWDYVTLLGGEGTDSIASVGLDSNDGIQVFGSTDSVFFPTTADAYQLEAGGGQDAFIARFDLTGSDPGHVNYSSYLGGSGTDLAKSMAIDPWGYTYLGGITESADFPVSFGAFDTSISGNKDGFVAKMAIGPIPGIYLETYTNGSEADTPPGPHLLYGSMVNWTYWIANTGPLALSGVTVTDNQGVTIICPKSTLNQGEVMTCTASGSATLGQYSNIGSVAANPPGGLPAVTDSDPSHYFGAQPSIQIVKKTNGVNSNIGPGPDILVGSAVNWTYDVTNTGNVPLTNVVVADSDLTLILDCTETTLAPGSTLTCNASGVAVGGNYENTATVTANPPDKLLAVSATDIDHYHGVGPDIQITKELSVDGGATWLPADVAPDHTLLSGYTPKFKITASNNGDVPLANLLVTDSVHNLSGCGFPTSLGIGASFPCIITGTWEAGTHVSTASISADYTDTSNNKKTVTDSISARYFGAQIGVSVEKEISLDNQLTWLDANDPVGQTLLNNGAVPRYRITTHNTSNLPLNVSLTDNPISLPGECASGVLQPDDGMPDAGLDQRICLVTGAWAAGPQLNTATASVTFTDSGGHTVAASDYDSANYFGASPGLTITFDISLNNANSWLDGSITPIPTLLSGFNPLYRLTILNNGNVRIEGIQVTDDELPLMGCETPVNLDSGSSKVCTALSVWSSGAHVFNISTHAEFSDSQGNSWTADDAKSAHYFGAVPTLSLTNEISLNSGATWLPADTAPGPYLLESVDQPQFRLTLTNSGNVAQTATLIDSGFSLLPGCANGLLAPSASRQCTITIGWMAGTHQNTATASAIYVDTAGHSRNVSDDDLAFYFGAWPLLNLEKYVSGDNGQTWQDADLQPGPYFLETSTLKYKLVLDNTGNVPVVNPNWSDPGFNLTTCPLPVTFTPEAAPVECTLVGTWTAGQHSNLASASSTYIDTAGHAVSPSDTDGAHYFGARPGITIDKRTNGEDADAAPGPTILAGGPVQWTYTITNTGNVPIAEISITDDNGTSLNLSDDFNAVCNTTNLLAGAALICTASKEAEIGLYVNNAVVTTQPKIGTTLIGPPLTAWDLSHYFGANISYTLEKTTDDDILDNAPPGPFIEIGQPVTWAFKVTNTGNVPLTNVQVWDDNGTSGITSDDRLVCTRSSIDPGKSNPTNSCEFTALALAGQYTNVGRAKVEMLDQEFTEYDYGHYYGYDPDQMLDMTVTLNSVSTGSPPGIYLPAGDDIQLLYRVYNFSLSETKMTITELTDDSGTPGDSSDDLTVCQNVELDSLSSHLCIRPVTQALVGQHTHTGQVTTMIDSAQLTHEAASSYFGVQGGITLDVHTNGQDPTAALGLPINLGDPVTWEYFIENTSNIPLTGINILDNHEYSISCPSTILAAGSNMKCTGIGTAQTGAFKNDATVQGVWPDDFQVFIASAESYYFGVQAGLTLEFKVNGLHAVEPPGPDIIIGENALLSYVVTNTGNFPVGSISVTDNFNLISCPYTTLAAESNMTCTANETVTAGLHSRTANANGLVNLQPISATDKIYFTGIPPTHNVFLPLILR
ncbi:MAG TPA: hypothetical protein VN364_13710 [Bellilinea sp.]|nr:hypothetical protein [Bellilinea sp.]